MEHELLHRQFSVAIVLLYVDVDYATRWQVFDDELSFTRQTLLVQRNCRFFFQFQYASVGKVSIYNYTFFTSVMVLEFVVGIEVLIQVKLVPQEVLQGELAPLVNIELILALRCN